MLAHKLIEARKRIMNLPRSIVERLASSLGYTQTEVVQGILSISLFYTSLVAFGRWWQWLDGSRPLYSPVLWTIVVLTILWMAPFRRWALITALGLLALYSLKSALFTGELLFFLITAAAVGLAFLIYRMASPESTENPDTKTDQQNHIANHQ